MKIVASRREAGMRVMEMGRMYVQVGKKLLSLCLKKVGSRWICRTPQGSGEAEAGMPLMSQCLDCDSPWICEVT